MTERIDRRELFRRASMGAGALAWPSFLATGFQDGPKKVDRVALLRATQARARKLGKVVTVFVIPADEAGVWQRGVEFGLLLNRCGPHTLLDLAACEPCCATVAELNEVFEGLGLESEPWILCLARVGQDGKLGSRAVEPDYSKLGEKPAAVGFNRDLEAYKKALEARDKAVKEWVQTKVAAMETAVTSTLAALRAELVRSPRDAQAERLIESISTVDEPAEPDLVFEHAAVLHDAMVAEKDTRRRARLVAALVAAGTKHYRTDRVPGSKWASNFGCGIDIEGEGVGTMIVCGTASTPPLSSRFLHFYAD